MKKGDKIVTLIILVIIILGFSFTFLYKHKNISSLSSRIAIIKHKGKVIKKIDLSKVKDEEIFVINSDNGHFNKVVIQKNKISISEADCPDKVCMKTGPISNPGDTLVCLPHKLIIIIEGKSPSKNKIDATTF